MLCCQVCKPRIPEVGVDDVAGLLNTGTGLRQIMYTRTICSGDRKEINDSLESFPSGHATAACEYSWRSVRIVDRRS